MEVHLHFWAGEAWTKKLQIRVFINFFFAKISSQINIILEDFMSSDFTPNPGKTTHP